MSIPVSSLIIGAGGQDGYYLTRELASRGRKVIGIDRRLPEKNRQVDHPMVDYVEIDIREYEKFALFLEETNPAEVYHLAAVHGSAGSEYEQIWRDMLAVNTGSLHVILEYFRNLRPDSWLFYASSCLVFGPLTGTINEDTRKSGADLYAICKKAGCELLEYYRSKHGISSLATHFFNHESPLRDPSFFISRIISILNHALNDPSYIGEIYNLDFHCDWGSAKEYMELVADAADRGINGELIIATGEAVFARDLVHQLFELHGLNYRDHIKEMVTDNEIKDPSDSPPFRADLRRLQELVGRRPRQTILDICEEVLEARRGHH